MIKKKKVLHQFVFSHVLIVLLCCVAVGIILVTVSEREICKTEEQAIRGKMRLALEDIETQLDVIQSIPTAIKTEIYYRPGYLQIDNLHEAEMIKQFASFDNISPLTNEFYLYYPSRQMVYSNKTRFSLEDLLKTRLSLADYETYLPRIEQTAENTLLYVDHQQAIFLYPFQLTGISSAEGRVILIAILPLSCLENRIHVVSALDREKVSFSVGEYPLISHIFESSNLLTEQSGSLSITFAYTGSSSVIVDYVQTGMLIIALITAVMCGLAIIVAFNNYAPIRRMLRLTGGDSSEDEFEHLRNTFQRMWEQNILSEKELEENLSKLSQQQAEFGQYLLINVLNGEISEQLLDQMRRVGLRIPYSYFRVLVVADDHSFSLEECAEFVREEPDKVICYAIPLKKPYSMALLENSQTEELLGSTGFFVKLCQRITNKYPDASLGMGCICHTLEDVPLSFASAIEALSARNGHNTADIRLETLLKHFRISFQNEDYEEAWEHINKILTDSPTESPQRTHYIQARIIAVLWQNAEKIKLSEETIAPIANAHEISEIRQSLKTLTRHLVQYQFQQPETADEYVMQYIRRNFSDSQFDLDAVVQACNLPEKTIRLIVRQTTGMNFMEYVKMLKIEKAKRLLREEKMSVNEICQSTGYTTTSYFIQLFKKMTGYTPKQYQEISGSSSKKA